MEQLDKEKLLVWVARMSLMYEEHGYNNHLYALNAITKEIESGTFDAHSDQEELERLREANKQLTEERDACLQVLEWYADETNHATSDVDFFESPAILKDGGNRARQFLQSRKGGGEG